ncbi:hypothetical protein ACFL28_04365 [Candidatus Omnitrophota bacterium]
MKMKIEWTNVKSQWIKIGKQWVEIGKEWMKDEKSRVKIWVIIIFFLIGGGYIQSFFAYKGYQENLREERQFTMDKFDELDDSLKGFSVTFRNEMDESKIEREKVLSKMEDVKDDIQGLKTGYKTAVSELKATIKDLKINMLTRVVENLQDDIDEFKMTVQDLEAKLDEARGGTKDLKAAKEGIEGIDLGKISVKKSARKKRRRKSEADKE